MTAGRRFPAPPRLCGATACTSSTFHFPRRPDHRKALHVYVEKRASGKAAAAKPRQIGRQAVFLIGTYFSGSTLLGNCLNAHPSIFFAGEIDRLEAFRREPDWTHQRERGCRLCSTQAEAIC